MTSTSTMSALGSALSARLTSSTVIRFFVERSASVSSSGSTSSANDPGSTRAFAVGPSPRAIASRYSRTASVGASSLRIDTTIAPVTTSTTTTRPAIARIHIRRRRAGAAGGGASGSLSGCDTPSPLVTCPIPTAVAREGFLDERFGAVAFSGRTRS